MTTKKITTDKAVYTVIALLIIIVAFLLLGGGPWIKGLMNEGGSVNITNWNWTQILISVSIGFLLGLVVGRRKW